MRTKRVNRYYCDYCRKGGCSGGHMANHERYCTKNPNRECRMCGNAVKPLELIQMVPTYTPDEGQFFEDVTKELDALRDACHQCPACMLSVVRQATSTTEFCLLAFDYKVECKRWWDDKNAENEGLT